MIQAIFDAKQRDSCDLIQHRDTLRSALANVDLFEKVLAAETGLMMRFMLRRFYFAVTEGLRVVNDVDRVRC